MEPIWSHRVASVCSQNLVEERGKRSVGVVEAFEALRCPGNCSHGGHDTNMKSYRWVTWAAHAGCTRRDCDDSVENQRDLGLDRDTGVSCNCSWYQ